MKPHHATSLSALCVLVVLLLLWPGVSFGQSEPINTTRGDKMIAEYFRLETAKLTRESLADIKTKADWEQDRETYRAQLRETLGLDPMPERTPLEPVITKTQEQEDFIVENLHFQSRPGLYVTGNFYRPKKHDGKLPTILYVCGHAKKEKDGVSFGNKTAYQHHGAWFARNGYACLTIDTLQLGEIEGIHHGTYRYGMWWWNARGYSPAGVEAWNCIRALDYLQTREEVDSERIGVTGRSGGGAYSWWIAALDERIKVAVPVAGITSLHNHVVDGCVEGHCDCMYQLNTYRWDYAQVAALVAPRPLLITNTDNDRIFPLDGVVDVYFKTRRIYELLGATDKIGLQISEGPHKDTQNLQVAAFHWFNTHLKGQEPSPMIEMAAVPFYEPEELRVFPGKSLPEDEINTTIHETFVPKAGSPKVPASAEEWKQQTAIWREQLETKCFRGWPTEEYPPGEKLDLKEAFSEANQGLRLTAYDFTSQDAIRLRLYVARPDGIKPQELGLAVLKVLDDQGWQEFVAMMRTGFAEQFAEEVKTVVDEKGFEQLRDELHLHWAMAYVAPRGIGPTAWDQSDRKQIQNRRRFMLLGQTLDGQRVWDTRRAVQALWSTKGIKNVDEFWLQGEREMAGIALYAGLFEPNLTRLDLWNLNTTHHDGPIFLNVLRFLDVPQAVAMARERSRIFLHQDDTSGWDYPNAVAKALGGENRISIRETPKKKSEAEPR